MRPEVDREIAKRNVIKSWLNRVLATGSYRDFEDLHIDVVDPTFSSRELWIPGGVESLTLAHDELRSLRVPKVVAIGFSLRAHELPSGLDAASAGQLESELDDSPPSLYVFDRGDEPWSADSDCRAWDGRLGIPMEERLSKYLREWYDDEDGEFRRSFWLTL